MRVLWALIALLLNGTFLFCGDKTSDAKERKTVAMQFDSICITEYSSKASLFDYREKKYFSFGFTTGDESILNHAVSFLNDGDSRLIARKEIRYLLTSDKGNFALGTYDKSSFPVVRNEKEETLAQGAFRRSREQRRPESFTSDVLEENKRARELFKSREEQKENASFWQKAINYFEKNSFGSIIELLQSNQISSEDFEKDEYFLSNKEFYISLAMSSGGELSSSNNLEHMLIKSIISDRKNRRIFDVKKEGFYQIDELTYAPALGEISFLKKPSKFFDSEIASIIDGENLALVVESLNSSAVLSVVAYNIVVKRDSLEYAQKKCEDSVEKSRQLLKKKDKVSLIKFALTIAFFVIVLIVFIRQLFKKNESET